MESFNCNNNVKSFEEEDLRKAFYFSEFGLCPSCSGRSFSRLVKVSGVKNMKRHGKDAFVCLGCKWSGVYTWNESCETYYTEPKLNGWKNPEDKVESGVVRLVKRPYALNNEIKGQPYEKIVASPSTSLGKRSKPDQSIDDIQAETTRLVRHSKGRNGQAVNCLDYQYTYTVVSNSELNVNNFK